MEFKKKDFKLLLDINGKKFLGLRYDYFDDKAPIGEPLAMEDVAEALEEAIEKVVEDIIVEEPVPTAEELAEQEPTAEELAEIEKEKKKAELLAQLKALE